MPFNTLKNAAFLVVTLLVSQAAWAQRPVIREVDKVTGSMTEVVTLKGSNFGTDATKLSVFFGATKAVIQFVNDQLMEVNLPAGTTYQYISVTNLTSGLTGYSHESFLLSFGGSVGFNPASLQGQFDFSSESGLYDICMCDFDSDKRIDIASASDNANFLDIIPNTSSGVGNVNFGKIQIALGTTSLHVTCGDINGDGKPDMVASEAGTGNRIFIFQNTSAGTGSFTFTRTEVSFTGKKTKRIEIADLDLDGKPELIISDAKNNNIIVLQNQSSLAAISFNPTPIIITIAGAASTDGLAIGDLNGDAKPEIITSQFLTGSSNLFIIQNKSTIGNFVLGDVITRNISGTIVNVRTGDLDFDGKKDIVVTQLLNNAISIFLNQSTTTAITLGSAFPVATEDRPWGLDFGDLDGDGKTDIVVASSLRKNLSILNNTSTPGSLSFTKSVATTTFINRHTKIGDVDGDGKPDIAFTSIDDNNLGIPASKVSVFRNSSCMVPEVTPAGPLTICAGFPLRLLATSGRGTTYEWIKDGSAFSSGINPFLDVTVSGDYAVMAIAEGGSCSEISNTVKVTVAGVGAAAAIASNNGPVCVGSTLTLSATTIAGATYSWKGPNNYTGTGASPASIPNFQLVNAGRYYVDVTIGSCIAQQTSTLVEANDVPEFTVLFTGSAVICQGDSKLLSANPTPTGFTYKWFEQAAPTTPIGTSSTYSAIASGEYFFEAKSPSAGCAAVNSNKVKISVVTQPVVNFTAPATACQGQNVQFTDQSTTDAQATAFYSWNFGDGSPLSTDKNPIHNFSSPSTFNVRLTVSYANNGCPVFKEQSIIITAAPPVTITNPDNKYNFCEGQDLKLEVLGTFSTYLWSTGSTDPSIVVTQAGTYSVDVGATNGCLLSASRAVTVFNVPDLNLSATPNLINEGETSQLSASGLNNYSWTPTEDLDNPNNPNPVASPKVTTVYTVTGSDANCTYEGTIEVKVIGEAIVGKLKPSNFFSPNGDAQNDLWKVDDIDQYPQCSITIYDDKGVKVFEAKPYLENWDGTFKGNGKPLPDGVYQYIIRCDGEENKPRKGSITILR